MTSPNILIFMTDHQRGDMAPPYHRAITPNLDRLAREGVAFSQAYCPAPHCCPSRATFFTGLYPSEHGVWNNVEVSNALSRGPFPGTRYWSDDLLNAGYKLYYSGKWHVSAVEDPSDRGWERTFPAPSHLAEKDFLEPITREWQRYKRLAQEAAPTTRGRAQILRPGYSTYTQYGVRNQPDFDVKTVSDAISKIRNRQQHDRPWCQFVGAIGPHDPYFVPQEYLDMYRLEDMELPPSFNDKMLDKPALYRRTRDRFDQLTEEEQRESLRHYLAYITYEDALFGQVLQALEETGQMNNTMIVYVSDHGDYAGDHGLWTKGLPCFRGAYHVPTIIRWPEVVVNPGKVVDAFVSLADFAPTFLEAAGLQANRLFSGQSLMPFLRGESPQGWRDAVFTQTNGNELYGIQRSVMTREWKYVYNGFDYDELYDITTDPHETVNLASDPRYSEIVRSMSRRLWRFAYEHNDACINPYIMVAHAPYGPAEAFCE